jgi:hypothetical protein
MASLLGLISVFASNPRLPLLYFPTLYRRMLKPKKSNPAGASDIALSVLNGFLNLSALIPYAQIAGLVHGPRLPHLDLCETKSSA